MGRDLSNERAGDDHPVGTRDDKHGLDAGLEVTVGERHLELRLKVTVGSKATHDEPGAHLLAEVDHEVGEHGDIHGRQVLDALCDEFAPLLGRKPSSFGRVLADPDDHAVEQLDRALHDVHVPERHRVERPRVDRGAAGGGRSVAHRRSILRPMARAEMALFVGCLFVGCGGAEPPEPKKVAEIEPVVKPRVRPVRKGPFRNPNTEAPGPREGDQLPDAELAEAIARGKALMAEGRATVAIQALRKCANKIPQSVACEAELAITMFEAKQQLAHAKHFLLEAANAQPAPADDALIRRIGETAIAKSQYPAARAAYGTLQSREVATADDLEQLARALQAQAGSVDEAADAYARAYSLDPTRHELLRKRATLLGQNGDHTRAADLFQAYLDKAKPEEKIKFALERRIAMLREEAKATVAPAPSPNNAQEAGKAKGKGKTKAKPARAAKPG